MTTSTSFTFVAILCVLPVAGAQTQTNTFLNNGSTIPNRAFALVQGSTVNVNGSWQDGDAVNEYAHAHSGHYIVFLQNGQLHRLNDPARVSEAERAYAPMTPLEARQRELSAQMKPLSEQQHALGLQQHAAAGDPAEQSRIGAEQGKVGQKQGEIGRQQGEVGRQQGEVGRAFYARVQGLLSACLEDGSCPAVSTEARTR